MHHSDGVKAEQSASGIITRTTAATPERTTFRADSSTDAAKTGLFFRVSSYPFAHTRDISAAGTDKLPFMQIRAETSPSLGVPVLLCVRYGFWGVLCCVNQALASSVSNYQKFYSLFK
jgi:hypothetical protein